MIGDIYVSSPDGARIFSECACCPLSDRRERPCIVLCEKPYCLDCYPKAVAVLDADFRSTRIAILATGEAIGETAKIKAAFSARSRMRDYGCRR